MNNGYQKRQADIPEETQVLIVGGGPVGLSAAVELGQRGVQCVVVEPRLMVSRLTPRAKTTSIRTMEHFRRWGLAQRIREVAPLKVNWSQDVVFCTTLLGHEITRFTGCFGLATQQSEEFAESGQQIAQPLVEEVLRKAVTELASCSLWWAGANGVPAEIGLADPYALIRGLVGADIDAEVLGTDPWIARMLLADHYRSDRVFLAGDAAHLNPPWGGHGFNTGIGDAVSIGWKLAAVLRGWGGEGLLASYETERRPVAERTIHEAVANMSVLAPELSNPELAVPGLVGEQARRAAAHIIQASKDREFHSLGLVLGSQYDASPVIVDDGTPPVPEGQHYEPTARPGARLPHLWLPDGASLYDRLGNGFSLLRLRDDADVAPFIEAAEARHMPLTVVELRGQALEERYGASLLLVRPDQHVAWRGASIDQPTADALIDRVRGA